MLPTLPSMQLDYRHFGHRFKRLMIVAANVALIRGEEGATELHKHRFFTEFAICGLQTQPTVTQQVTSFGANYATLFTHKKLYTTFHVLPKKCRSSLVSSQITVAK